MQINSITIVYASNTYYLISLISYRPSMLVFDWTEIFCDHIWKTNWPMPVSNYQNKTIRFVANTLDNQK